RGRGARARLGGARSAFALGYGDAARKHLHRSRETCGDDPLLALELDIEQAALDLWGDNPKVAGRTLARDAARRARRLFEANDRARGPYLEALRVEYEAAYQEDDLETMVRAAEERADLARGFDEEAHLPALLASA